MRLSARSLIIISTAVAAACSQPPKSAPKLLAEGDPAKRESCEFGPGSLVSESNDKGTPYSTSIPVDTVVLVMQENRSFDHYFAKLTVPGQTVDVAPTDATNPDPTTDGGVVHFVHQTEPCFEDVHHGWTDSHTEAADGGMTGFAAANVSAEDPTGQRSLSYYDENDLPFYFGMARTFALSDRHFASVLGPTQPNRLFFMAGTSFGWTKNPINPTLPDGSSPPTLFTRLDDANIMWKAYSTDLPTPAIFVEYFALHREHFAPLSEFFTDAAAGKLPPVVFVDGSHSKGGANTSEHPPAPHQLGQAHVASVVKALIASPQWEKSALFWLYDEHGGFYDHVSPPKKACEPDNIFPTTPEGARFDHLGVRVPMAVVSPYAKRGYVSHVVTDHTSVLKFVETRFNLPALTKRDANAAPPFDMFDFDHPDFSRPALPDAPVDQAAAEMCAAKWPPPVNSQ